MSPTFKVRHAILGLLCAMYFVAYIDRVNISVAGPLIRKELGLGATELGWIFAAFAYPYAGMQVVGGWLSDRFGARVVLAALSLLWAGATILTGLSWSVASLVGFRVLVGLGEGGAFPTATRALTFWFPVRERGFAQGITHSSARLGGAITPPVVLAIVAAAGWRESFIALGALSALWTAAWVVLFRNTPAEHRAMTARELKEVPSSVIRMAPEWKRTPWRELISRMWLVTLVDFCYGWSLWVFLTWLPSYLTEARGFDLNAVAFMTMLPLMAGVIGDTLGGVISDAVFRRSGNLRLARVGPLVVGLLGALLFMIPAVTTDSPRAAVYGLAIAFLFLELTNAVLWALPIDIAGAYAGTAGGIMNTGFGVAGMISPVVFGAVIERTGRYDLPFFVSAALLLLGAICALFIDPGRHVQSTADWAGAVTEGTYA